MLYSNISSSEKEKKNEKRRKEKKGCNRNSDKHSATDSSDNTYVFEGCPLVSISIKKIFMLICNYLEFEFNCSVFFE